MAEYTLSHTGAELDEAIGKVLNGYEPAVSAVEQATPVITVGTDGLITASATQKDGHVPAGTKTSTKQLTTQAAKTVTPSTSEQTAVSSGAYTTGTVKVAAVPTETKSITSNGTYTPTSGKFFSSVTVNVPTSGGLPSSIVAGDTPVLSSSKLVYTCTATSMTATGISVSITKAGTYRFKFSCGRTSTSGTWTTQLYKNGSAVSGATVTWSSYQGTCTADISCSAGDTIEIYARSRSTSYRNIVGQLVACIDWDNGI